VYLIFDTETSDMVQRDLPPDHEAQPRLVQIAAFLVDAEFSIRAEIGLLVKPAGATFAAGAVKVHGIAEETAERFGVPLPRALELFSSLCGNAQFAVAHNIAFDAQVMAIQYAREGLEDPLPALEQLCTMTLAQPLCGIERQRGPGFKPPTLGEAYRHFFRREIENAHDALVDARACLEIFREIRGPKRKSQGLLF
jgi:DNA polymerase-3 subunit epsilon